jgi:hypothetical protein
MDKDKKKELDHPQEKNPSDKGEEKLKESYENSKDNSNQRNKASIISSNKDGEKNYELCINYEYLPNTMRI